VVFKEDDIIPILERINIPAFVRFVDYNPKRKMLLDK
jgi:hypothetical protein